MAKYLLSLHSVEGEAGPSMTDNEMHQYMGKIHVLEDEMKSAGGAAGRALTLDEVMEYALTGS